MRRVVLLLVVAAVSVALAVLAVSARASDGGELVVRFLGPVDGGLGWRVEAVVGGLRCSGVVRVNPGYLQARAVSGDLVVLPVYYVLSSVCSSGVGLVGALDRLAGLGRVRVVFEAPPGFMVRSGLDWRGFGPPGGPYVVPGGLLRRFYLFDGLVVFSNSSYVVRDFPGRGFSLVVYRGFGGARVEELVGAVGAAASMASGVFGVSPRSPVVGVLASPRGFVLLAPSTAYSLGGVFLVVDSLAGRGEGWYVHVFAHEAVHGWVNDGLVYGDFSFGEAVVEFLALRGLYVYNRSLYGLAEPYSGEGVDSGEPYAVWMRAHAALWALAESMCGFDAYSWALGRIFSEALNSSTPRIYSVVDVLGLVGERCGRGPLAAWGSVLPRVEGLNVTRVLAEPGYVVGLAGWPAGAGGSGGVGGCNCSCSGGVDGLGVSGGSGGGTAVSSASAVSGLSGSVSSASSAVSGRVPGGGPVSPGVSGGSSSSPGVWPVGVLAAVLALVAVFRGRVAGG